MAHARILELGFLSSPSATFITRKTAMPHAPSPKPIPWMASLLAGLLHPMQCLFTIPANRNTVNRTATVSIRIVFLRQYILQLNRMVASLSPYTGMTPPSSANRTLLEHVSKKSTHYQGLHAPAR
jgi:hypothetical protein